MNRQDAIKAIREKSGMTYGRIAEIVDNTSPELIEHYIREGRMGDGITTDPIEADPVVGPIIDKVRIEANERLQREKGSNDFWPPLADDLAQRILKGEHGIEWRTLQQMNPDVHFNYGESPKTD